VVGTWGGRESSRVEMEGVDFVLWGVGGAGEESWWFSFNTCKLRLQHFPGNRSENKRQLYKLDLCPVK
jgi:hypothetical protein